MNPKIFKAYDVRGVVPDELDSDAAFATGRAIARFLGEGPVVVGRDMRESGVELGRALKQGLCTEGLDVVDIGRVTTPIVYFATADLRAAGGVMITASHNPGGYNGFKICRESARPVGIETGLAEIRDTALALVDETEAAASEAGRAREESVSERYVASLLGAFPERPRLSVAIDCGNGIAGEALTGLLDALPLETTRLYFEPDGTFPNHEANPLVEENLRDLQQAVRDTRADLGIAFDGDGDRAVFVDERGDAVPADLMTAVFADHLLERGLLGVAPGATIIYDLRSSRAVAETIERRGGKPLRCRVGHAFIKQRMRETGAAFGGELSGHYYFRLAGDYIADDGAAAMMLVLQVLAASGRPLSELWRPLRLYSQSGEVNREVPDVSATLARVRDAFPKGEADELDGLTVSFPDWWFNLRPSNTEPLVRLNVEAPSEAAMVARRDEILAVIEESCAT